MDIWFNPVRELDALLRAVAPAAGFGDEPFDPEIRPADPRFGDFQANGVLARAKALKKNPRALATALVENITAGGALDGAFVAVEIAGPGFINFRLTPAFLDAWLARYADADAFSAGAAALYAGRRVVIDYPSPNTAKQMHVGHLRPMVIGEAIARLLQFCGADLIRDNHIGDWGTNFGVLIWAIKNLHTGGTGAAGTLTLEALEDLYKRGSAATKADPAALDAARAELVKLQTGDPENLALWERIVATSNSAFQEMYDLLGVHPDVTLGESFYRDKVGRVYEELLRDGLAEESDGALVVWHDEHPRFSRNAEPSQPFIVRKKDGGSNYAGTDLATLLYRVEHYHADECVYVTDGRQQDHFQQLFLTAEKWFRAEKRPLPVLRHVWFGTILGEDGRAIKTKSGDPVRLKTLLDEAVERAAALTAEKNPDLPAAEREHVARTVGIAAVRYADLSQNRTLDYTFSWKKLLAFDGNTAPYLLYAVARIRSIFRKAGEQGAGSGEQEGSAGEEGQRDKGKGQKAATGGAADADSLPAPCSPSALETPAELALARKLVAFPAALAQACEELRPHHLCAYLFDLAGAYSTFNNADKVLVDDAPVRARRLRLCDRTATALTIGLRLLGIEPLERM
ncbi:MAG: arginine--tRNA ligase [Puniceicoccales bacterium]|nr:arginine--tRNA ligase [Puniceicoccales bacterium]